MLALLILFFSVFQDAKWINFQSDYGKFSLEIPDWPREDKQFIPTPNGDLISHIYTLDLSEKKLHEQAYLVSFTEFPPHIIHSDKTHLHDQFFENSMNGSAVNVGGKDLSSSTISHGKYPGREFVVSLPTQNQFIHQRLYLIKNRTYMLQVVTSTNRSETSDMKKFFNSFQSTE